MFNRILTSYTPGSSIKPIVGAIGLSGEYFTSDEDFGRSGTKWQLDSSWKNLYVTTTETYSGPAILQNALIYSDNIYFAKAGIKIGIDNLQAGFNKFGFNSKIDFDQNLTESTYGKIDSSSMLASTSYGQGELLVNPVHMALMYSVFTQGGNMIKPYILYKDNPVLEYSRTNIISPEIANEIKEDLLQVVLQGTAKECIIEGKNIYGKTGTAEIKATQDDKNGHETGWFNAFDDNGHLIVSVIENVEHRGGSHYVVRKTKGIFEGM
jgi:penicillin-binding protein